MITKFQFTDVVNGRNFIVTWPGMRMFSAGPVKVLENETLLGEFQTTEEIMAGKEFRASDGKTIRVVYEKVFWFISAINVYLEGQKIMGSQMYVEEN
jgi:hypothetical protein